MYLVLYLQVCFVLVSSSPLYDFNCCTNTYPNYGNDQSFIVQRSNYNPYGQDLLVHNRMNPITNSQPVPHQYQYLNTNNFVPNYQLFNQNGLEILQNVPEAETEKVINNYILIPQEYFHNNAIENKKDTKTGAEIGKNTRKNKSKRRRPHMESKINNGDYDISNQETKSTRPKGQLEDNENAKSGRKKCKKKTNTNNSDQLTTNAEETLPLKKLKNQEEAIIRNTNNHLVSSCGKNSIEKNKSPSIRPNYQEPKPIKGSTNKELASHLFSDVNIASKKKDDTGFADVNVCFDINEDCTDLVCRHTRNKDLNKINKPQSLKPQPDLPNNLNNYMNSLNFNQEMTPNVLSPNVNFPFNFNYLYQTSQTSNVNPKESNNRRRNRKRKQPPSNRQTHSNKKNKNTIITIDSCDRVVELNPEIPKVETTTLSTITTKTTTHTEELERKNNGQVEMALETDEGPNVDNPTSMYTETLLTENLNNDKISNSNNVPVDKYIEVMDEYYPDFNLDNTYMTSKEDFDFGNFHGRHYYTYGDKPELNRERRKYEHTDENKINGNRKFNIRNQNKNIIQEPSQIQEILCKTDLTKEKVNLVTSSTLQFPGFKTEMINKEKYFAKEKKHGSKNFVSNDIPTDKVCPSSKHTKGKKNLNNDNVEMVFAKSKVVRYGVPEKEEIITKVPEPELKREFKNLISTDGKTTVVIAKSLGYS